MDKIKVSTDRRSEPHLHKLARALISIARRQLNDETASTANEATPNSSKDAA